MLLYFSVYYTCTYNIILLFVIHRLATVSKKQQTASMSHVTVVAGLPLTLDHYQPLKLHIKITVL